jgi:hypothetical protein
MIGELMSTSGALGTLGVALVIFGFAPGMVLAAIVRLLNKDDPRRRELQAELYAVPRWERPFWVCDQFEVCLREGLFPEVGWYWGRHIWHRSRIESGVKMNSAHPDSFLIPSDADKAELGPGDAVKLMWTVRRFPGERMWVQILHRDGDRFTGALDSDPFFVYMVSGETIRFTSDDIVDYILAEDRCEGGDCEHVERFDIEPCCEGCNGLTYPKEQDNSDAV